MSEWKKYVVTLSALSQLGCFFCVARGAKVKTPRGDRNIEDLRVGDEVTVVDPVTRELHTGLISHIRSANRETARLVTSRGSLRVTTSHPLYDPSSNEWAPAGDWVLGLRTSLLRIDGNDDVTARVAFDGLDEVFDLSIDHPAHTFVADGVVVHNKSPPPRRCSTGVFASTDQGAPCACDYGEGVIICDSDGAPARCSCDVARQPTVALSFQSRWVAGSGDDAAVLLDGGWTRFTCEDAQHQFSLEHWSVVGRAGASLRVTSPGEGRCAYLEKVDAFPSTGSHFGSVFFSARSSQRMPLIVLNASAPQAVLLESGEGVTAFVPSFDASGQPLTGPTARWSIQNFVDRYEWQLEFITETTYRFWPRASGGSTVVTAANFLSEPDAAGNRTSLADWYAAGNTFGFTDVNAARVLSLGLTGNSEDQASFSYLGLSTEGWLSPQSE